MREAIYILAAGMLAAGWEVRGADNFPGTKREPLVVVVHKSNPVNNLSGEELRKIFLGDRAHWPNGRKVTLALRATGQPEREAVTQAISGMSDAEFNRHWLQRNFTGESSGGPKELASAAGVRKFIFNVPGAIGCMRTNDVDDSVKVIRIDGHLPTDADYKLAGASP